MVLKTEYTVAGIIIALLIGSGAGYIYGQSPIAGYKEEVDRLETENLGIKEKKEQLLEEYTNLQDQLTEVKEDLSSTQSSLEDLQIVLAKTKSEHEALQLSYSSLKLSYEAIKEDYDKLRECIPPGVGMLYSEMKKTSEGYIKHDLIGACGQDYLLPAPINSDVWEVNITIVSELSWQPVHIKIYKVIEDYPPDWLGQPFAPYARGEGEVSISLKLNTSYAYVVVVSDAYAKAFTGFIEERWYLEEKEIKIVVNGDFEEPTWNVEGWETSGHLSAGSGEDSLEGRQLSLIQDLGAVASQKVYLYQNDLNLEFYYRPVPMGIPLDFIVYFDDKVILNESFTGSILPWTSMRISLDPLMDTYGEHTIKFVVPKNPDCTNESSRVMIDKVSIGRFQIEWILSSPTIDGHIGEKEWGKFQPLVIPYWITYKNSTIYGAQPWDTKDKNCEISLQTYASHLYMCLKIPGYFLSKEYPMRILQIYLDDHLNNYIDRRGLLLGSEYYFGQDYPFIANIFDGIAYRDGEDGKEDIQLGGTCDTSVKYSHTSNGISSANGTYIFEFDLPLKPVTNDVYDAVPGNLDIKITWGEATYEFLDSSYWKTSLKIEIPTEES